MKLNNFSCVLLIVIISLILYFNPLFSNKPLGLDALGHLSKVSYLKEFGLFVSWDLAWYNGAPFLAYYSPLFYYVNYLFDNIIFGANFICFLSILLTSIGIFFLIKYYTGNNKYSLIFALFFLSVLSTSYYYISVGNHPYVFAIFTIPFTLLFLEKSFVNRNFNFFIYCLFFVLAYLSHIFIALCLFLLVFIRVCLYCNFNNKNHFFKESLKKGLIYLIIPMLLSSFWFLPFLSKSKSFIGDGVGYIPSPIHLAGFGNYSIWGNAPGEIGVLFILFVVSLFLSMKYLKEEKILFLFLSGIVFLLLLSGILWKFYPTGVGAIRFILPFAILTGIFCGVILFKRFGEKKIILFILILLLILSLYLNYKMINENYEKFSYNSDEDRYGLIDYLYESKEFPVLNNFTNYRFGTTRYIFSETLNYKFPWASQTWGYFDQGNLYPEELLNFKKTIWGSENITSTKKYFGDYGIKYLEIGGADLKFEKKFSESEDFSLILERNFSDYPFKIFEYKKAKPIISVIKNDEYENISKFMVKRTNPDNIIITYNFSGNEKILFKESYHKSWGAKDMSTNQKIKILKSDKGFMVIEPKANSKEILIYQKKTNLQIAGLIISIIILFLILRYTLKR